MRKILATAVLLVGLVAALSAQSENKNALAIGIGHTFISDQTPPNTNFFDNTVHSGKGWTFDFSYERLLKSFGWASVGAELPVLWNPDEDLNYGLNQVPKQYSSIIVTPAVRLHLLPNAGFSPWLSFGGGIARFSASKELEFNNTINPGPRIKTAGALHGGVGLDVPLSIIVHRMRDIDFRFEAIDNWTGEPPINVNTGKTREHNYYVGGAAVFKF